MRHNKRLTSKKGALAGSSSRRSGPSPTVNPFLQKVITWSTGCGACGVPLTGVAPAACSRCRGSPASVRAVPENTPRLLGAAGDGSKGPSRALPLCLTRLNNASTSRWPLEGS